MSRQLEFETWSRLEEAHRDPAHASPILAPQRGVVTSASHTARVSREDHPQRVGEAQGPVRFGLSRVARPLLVGFVAAACVYVFFLEPWGHDTYFHLQRMQDITEQFGRGQFRAHFAGNVAEGRGLPVWVYYSQWVYWPATLLTALGASLLVALKLLYCICLIVTCVGCFRLLRLHGDRDAAMFGTLVFVTSNYVIGEIFVRSAYAEFLSVAPMPLLLLALHRTLVDGRRGAGTAVILLTALMILFHPLSFMNAALGVAAYAVYVVIGWRVPYRNVVRLVPLFALALALTAFYWLPAVIETRYVLGAAGVPTPLRETFLGVRRYFLFISITNVGFVLTVLAMVVAGGLLLGLDRRPAAPERRPAWPLVVGIVTYVFLTLRISEPLYTTFPILASTLWVWRVLFPLTLLAVIFVTSNLRALPARWRTEGALAAVAALTVLQAAVVVLWDSAPFLSMRRVEAAEIQERLALESRQMKGFGVDEYLPDSRILPRPEQDCPAVRRAVPSEAGAMRWSIPTVDADTCIHIPRYWNVRYAATIDGTPTPVYATAAGEILLMPGGRSGAVSLRVVRPTYATLSNLLSIAAAGLVLTRLVRTRRMRQVARCA